MPMTSSRSGVIHTNDGHRAVCDPCGYRGKLKDKEHQAEIAFAGHSRTQKHLRICREVGGVKLADELALRLADVAEMLAAVETDDDGEIVEPHTGSLLSALDYALRGEPGCVDMDEWQGRRREALVKHGGYLGVA